MSTLFMYIYKFQNYSRIKITICIFFLKKKYNLKASSEQNTKNITALCHAREVQSQLMCHLVMKGLYIRSNPEVQC